MRAYSTSLRPGSTPIGRVRFKSSCGRGWRARTSFGGPLPPRRKGRRPLCGLSGSTAASLSLLPEEYGGGEAAVGLEAPEAEVAAGVAVARLAAQPLQAREVLNELRPRVAVVVLMACSAGSSLRCTQALTRHLRPDGSTL